MKTSSKILIAKIIFKILIFFGFKKKTIVKRNDIKWNIDISEGIDLSIFLFGAFQPELVKSIKRHILDNKSNKTFFNIIDIGANIGDKSLSLSSSLLKSNFSNFKIFTIEPTDYAFKKQISNINLNQKLKKKIFSYNNFISNKKNKPKKIYSSWSLDTNKTLDHTHKIHKGILKKINKSTKNISLDDFIKKNKIKDQIILKIDVDGFEMDVLKSSVETLKRLSPTIFIEYAPYSFAEHGSSVNEFYRFIRRFNYQMFDLNFNKLCKVKISEGSSKDIILIKD